MWLLFQTRKWSRRFSSTCSIYNKVLFLYPKLINSFLCVGVAWFQAATWEVWMVRCVRELLCLEANSAAAWECGAMLTRDTSQEVACIHLQAWFGGVNLHCAATDRILDLCCETQLAFLFLIENEVVVVALSVLYLFVVGIDVLTYGFGVRKSKGVPSTLRISPVGIETLSIGR